MGSVESEKLSKVDRMVKRYKAGDSCREISEKDWVDVSRDTVRRRLNAREDVEMRGPSERLKGGRTSKPNSVNDEVFDELDEESAYWVGFLMADGSVRRFYGNKTDRIALCLNEKDEDHVRRFRSFVGSENSVVRTESNNSVSIRFSSNRISERLRELGLKQNKKFTDTSVSGDLKNDLDFWRGMVDGDGHISDKNGPLILLTGRRPLVEQFRDFLFGGVGVRSGETINSKESDAFYFKLAYGNAVTAIRELYEDCEVALNRKQQVAKEILSNYPIRS